MMMYKVIFKSDHNADIKAYDVRANYDRDSIVETLIEQGSMVLGSGYCKGV